jgi:hypothetical protein
MTVETEKRNRSRMAERIAALAGTPAPPISPIPHPQTMTTLHRPDTLPRPQYVISEAAALTWIEPRAKGGVLIGQGRNRICLNRDEFAKLIEAARKLDPKQPAYTTTTPAKARLMRYPVKTPDAENRLIYSTTEAENAPIN